MKRFYQNVDKRSRKTMVSFLKSHERYDTANSWNHSTSYAHNLKIYGLGLEAKLTNKLYDLIDTEEFHELLRQPMHDFAVAHNYQWQAAMNGRSGGYLVLYQGGAKKSEFHSYCMACGQKRFPPVVEGGSVCKQSAVKDFPKIPMETFIYPWRGTDMDEDFEDWEMWELRNRVELVQEFDQLADTIVHRAIDIAKNFSIETETVFVAKNRKVMAPSV